MIVRLFYIIECNQFFTNFSGGRRPPEKFGKGLSASSLLTLKVASLPEEFATGRIRPLSTHITNMNSHKHSPGSIISSASKLNSETNDEAINDQDNKLKKIIEWSYDNEEILAEWCDIAQCYKWLNHHSHDYYSSLHAWFTIPAITFSTISGTASFASASIPVEYQSYAPMAIGTINILIGILTTIQQYLKVSELKESYRLGAIAWDKYARNICIELSKSPMERIEAGTFLKFSRQEYDRLMESNQSIPPHIVAKFRRNFRGNTAEEKKRFDLIKKPDICDVIVSINEKRHMWFTNHHQNESMETDSIDTTSTFRDYMIFKQNTINNRNIPSYVDNIPEPEPEQLNKRSYDRKFSTENLLKHDHLYNNNSDIENNSKEYVKMNNENNRSLPKRNSKDVSTTAPRRTSKGVSTTAPRQTSQDVSTTAPRRISQEIAMNMKDSFFKKLFNQSPSDEYEAQQNKSSSKSVYDKKSSEKTVSTSMSNTSRNKNKEDRSVYEFARKQNDIESGFISKPQSPIRSSMRKSSSMKKMYGINDDFSETTYDSLNEPELYDEFTLSNMNDIPRNRTRSNFSGDKVAYEVSSEGGFQPTLPYSRNKNNHLREKENPITLVQFDSLDSGRETHSANERGKGHTERVNSSLLTRDNSVSKTSLEPAKRVPSYFADPDEFARKHKELDSNHSSNSSILMKNPNKTVKRVTHESDPRFDSKSDVQKTIVVGERSTPEEFRSHAMNIREESEGGIINEVLKSNEENITFYFQEDEMSDTHKDDGNDVKS